MTLTFGIYLASFTNSVGCFIHFRDLMLKESPKTISFSHKKASVTNLTLALNRPRPAHDHNLNNICRTSVPNAT